MSVVVFISTYALLSLFGSEQSRERLIAAGIIVIVSVVSYYFGLRDE